MNCASQYGHGSVGRSSHQLLEKTHLMPSGISRRHTASRLEAPHSGYRPTAGKLKGKYSCWRKI